MRRWTTGLIALITAVSFLQTPALAAGSARSEAFPAAVQARMQTSGSLEVTLNLTKAETARSVLEKKLRMTLQDAAGTDLLGMNLSAEEQDQSFTAGGQTCAARAAALNDSGTAVTTENEIHYFHVRFDNLPAGAKYRVALSGRGYTDFTSEEITLDEYSKHLVADTSSKGFTMGDADGSGRVTGEDLSLVRGNLGKRGLAGVADGDLNLDGAVDIADIALVNHHLNPVGAPEVFDTSWIAAAVPEIVLPDGVTIADGDPGDLFVPDRPVTFEAQGGARIQIPIILPAAVEMSEISITSPDAAGAPREGVVTVEDAQGGQQSFEFNTEAPDGVHPLRRSVGNSTVVVKLGGRVAVKKVTVVVTRAEGSTDYAVVDEIKFLKDIVPDNPPDNSVPKDVRAEEMDSAVRLTWKPVRNVTGYVVRYGTASGRYELEAGTAETEIQIEGLKNLTPYYFTVVAANDAWRGTPSAEMEATPQPRSAPKPPDNLKLTPGDGALFASWGKTKNALTYAVYYKKTTDSAYIKAGQDIEELSFSIGGLENGVEYEVYVTASNAMGESGPSLVSAAVPEKQEIEAPAIPTLNRISNDEITEVELFNKNNVMMSQYPNGFDIRNVVDGDYATHWTAKTWNLSHAITYTFASEHTMDYVVYVPRLDGNYRKSLDRYAVTVWDSQGRETAVVPGFTRAVQNSPDATGFAILTFPKTEHIRKIRIEVTQWAGSPTDVSLSEIAFYEYSGMSEEIRGLFDGDSYTSLAPGVSKERIDELRRTVEGAEGYYVDRKILLDELDLAQSLLDGDASKIGRVIDGVESRRNEGDIKWVSALQPLGVVANAKKQVVVYADLPAGETLEVVPTQYFAEAGSWKGTPVTLVPGRNVITIPDLISIKKAEHGGPLYLRYSGGRPEQIKLQVRGEATAIPVLSLSEWDTMNDSARRAEISRYVSELSDYAGGLSGANKETNIRNATEISLPHVLLSIPATAVSATGADALYQNALAWEELLDVLYRTHGVDDISTEHSRQNIRYMRMFADAFMYASGDHVGVGFGSAGGLTKGRPTSATGAGSANGLFGWGIAHEIGHVLDTLGKAEITNNIYSLFAQTYDGGNNALKSRLEGGKYADIFQKTAVGSKGMANDVFVSLGMYWQLHLAYDGAGENFYNKLNRYMRENGGADFMEAAQAVAGENLDDFFARWGLADTGRSDAQGTGGTRLINYLSDESRRARLKNEPRASGTVEIAASAAGREVKLNISGSLSSGRAQGYEISRNGKSIAFVTPGDDLSASYTDLIGSMNNRTLTYSVKAVDLLGYVYADAAAAEIRIEADNAVSRDAWSANRQSDGTILVSFDPAQSLAGFVVRGTLGDSGDAPAAKEPAKGPADPIASEPDGSIQDQGQEEKTEDDGEVKDDNQEDTPPKDPEATIGDSEERNGRLLRSPDLLSIAQEKKYGDRTLGSSGNEDGGTKPEDGDTPQEDGGTKPEDSDISQEDGETKPETGETSTGDGEIPPENEVTLGASSLMTMEIMEESGWRTVKKLDLDSEALGGTQDITRYFELSDSADGRVGIFDDVTRLRIQGWPDTVSLDRLDFISYSGDDIAVMENGIGHLAHNLSVGDDTIPAGTLIIAGTYVGDPVYNKIHIDGVFSDPESKENDASQGGQTMTERPLNGAAYLFAQMPSEGDMSEVSDGLWIFVPDVQREADLAGGDGSSCTFSVLPAKIRAVLYRTDDPDGSANERKVSETLWISVPTEDTMPKIVLEEGETGR